MVPRLTHTLNPITPKVALNWQKRRPGRTWHRIVSGRKQNVKVGSENALADLGFVTSASTLRN